MRLVIVKSKSDQSTQRFNGRVLIKVQLRLEVTDIGISLLQHREVKPFLAAEIMVDHMLDGLGTVCDGIHSGAVQTAFRELFACSSEYVLSRPLRIQLTPSGFNYFPTRRIHPVRSQVTMVINMISTAVWQ